MVSETQYNFNLKADEKAKARIESRIDTVLEEITKNIERRAASGGYSYITDPISAKHNYTDSNCARF